MEDDDDNVEDDDDNDNMEEYVDDNYEASTKVFVLVLSNSFLVTLGKLLLLVGVKVGGLPSSFSILIPSMLSIPSPGSLSASSAAVCLCS